MKKWCAMSLIGVAAAGLLWMAGNKRSSAHPQGTAAPASLQDLSASADIRVHNMRLAEQHGPEPSWRVFARQAMFFEAGQFARVQQIKAELLRNTTVIRLTAARGLLRSDTGDMTVEGQVSLEQQNGLVIETDSLRWRASDRLLYTDAPVVLHGLSASVAGQGLRSRVDQQRLTIPHKVKASFRLPGPG
jgi:LPS export ABC transporter protein LptC